MASTQMGHMSDPTEYRGEMHKFTVWTSASDGDLFLADRIVIDDVSISFYIHPNLVRKYNLVDFVKNNPELLSGIQIK